MTGVSELGGRRALVTGAGSGMGRATAIALAERGAEILAVDIDGGTAAEAADVCRAAGAVAHPVALDVADPVAVPRTVDELTAAHGPIDIAINAAGIGPVTALSDIGEDELRRVLDVNLLGTYLVFRALLPGMRERGWGRLIGFSSLNAKTPPPQLTHYAASKAAVIGFVQAVALEAAPAVTVNCVCPGMMETAMMLSDLETARRTDPETTLDDVRDEQASFIPLGRVGQPEEVTGLIAYLCTDAAAFVTGAAINVSGGQEMG